MFVYQNLPQTVSSLKVGILSCYLLYYLLYYSWLDVHQNLFLLLGNTIRLIPYSSVVGNDRALPNGTRVEISSVASRPGCEHLPCTLLHAFFFLPDDDKALGDVEAQDKRNLGS